MRFVVSLFVQGGTILGGSYLMYTSELLSFNMDTCAWKSEEFSHELDLQSMPLARDFHSGVYVNHNIIIFGGKCKLDFVCAWNDCFHCSVVVGVQYAVLFGEVWWSSRTFPSKIIVQTVFGKTKPSLLVDWGFVHYTH